MGSRLITTCSSLSPVEMKINRPDQAVKEATVVKEEPDPRVRVQASRLANWADRVVKEQRPTTCTVRRELVERATRGSGFP